MSTLNDGGAGEEVKQGRYANALILILISCLGVVGSYFSYQFGQLKADAKATQAEERAEAEKDRAREDKIREQYQKKLDERELHHERRYNVLQAKLDSIRDNIVTEAKMGSVKSEALASQGKKNAKAFQAEVQKTKEITKELDSVSNSVSKSLPK